MDIHAAAFERASTPAAVIRDGVVERNAALRRLGLDPAALAAEAPGTLVVGDHEYALDVTPLDGASLVEVRDITARRALERSLRLHADILDNSSALIFVKDAEGRYQLVNDEFCRRFALPREQVLGRTDHDLFPPDAADAYVDHDHAVLASGRPIEAEEPLSDVLDGRWLSIKFPLRDEQGRPYALGGISTDITDRTRAEAAKDELLSRISHELRTPLNAILGFAQLLALHPLEDRARAEVEHILKAGEHLLGLVDDVLEITRPDAQTATQPVHASESLAEALELIAPLARAHDIVVGADLHGGMHRYVRGEPRRLRQVLLNLLANAVKYNREHGAIRARFADAPDGRLRIVIVDTGRGLTPDEAERAFRPFERLDADRDAIEGTGLGLALSRSLAESMGGTVGVQHTEPGQGSSFYVELVLTEAPAHATTPGRDAPAPVWDLGATRILYIEDEPANLELVRDVLDRAGGRVELLQAGRGEEGVELAARHRPDLVLLDLGLADLPGVEVLERLTADPRTEAIPVVVLSADATPASIERMRSAGVAAYLTKPLRVATFLRTLRTTLAPRG